MRKYKEGTTRKGIELNEGFGGMGFLGGLRKVGMAVLVSQRLDFGLHEKNQSCWFWCAVVLFN